MHAKGPHVMEDYRQSKKQAIREASSIYAEDARASSSATLYWVLFHCVGRFSVNLGNDHTSVKYSRLKGSSP